MAADDPIDSKEELEPAGLAQRTDESALPYVTEEASEESGGPGDPLDGEYDQASSASPRVVADIPQSEQPRTDADPSNFMDLESDSDSSSDYSIDVAEEGLEPLKRFDRGSTNAGGFSAQDSHANDYFSFPTDEQAPVETFPFGRPQWWFAYARDELEARYGTTQGVLKHVYSVGDDIEHHPNISRRKWTRGMYDLSRPKSRLNPASQNESIRLLSTVDEQRANAPVRPPRPASGLFDDDDDNDSLFAEQAFVGQTQQGSAEQTSHAAETSPSPLNVADLPESSSKLWADPDDEDEADEHCNWAANLLADTKASFANQDAFSHLPFDNDSGVWEQTPADKGVVLTHDEEQSEAGPNTVRTTLSSNLLSSADVNQELSVCQNSSASSALTAIAMGNVLGRDNTPQDCDNQTNKTQDATAHAQSSQTESDDQSENVQKLDHIEVFWTKKFEKMKIQLESERREAEAVLIAQLNDSKEQNSRLEDQICQLKQSEQDRGTELIASKEHNSQLVERLSAANNEITRLTGQPNEPEVGYSPPELDSVMRENECLMQENERLKQLLLTAQKACQHLESLLDAREAKPQVNEPSAMAPPEPSALPRLAPRQAYHGWNFANPLRPTDREETEEEKRARWKAQAAQLRAESPRHQAKLRRLAEETDEEMEQRLIANEQRLQEEWRKARLERPARLASDPKYRKEQAIVQRIRQQWLERDVAQEAKKVSEEEE